MKALKDTLFPHWVRNLNASTGFAKNVYNFKVNKTFYTDWCLCVRFSLKKDYSYLYADSLLFSVFEYIFCLVLLFSLRSSNKNPVCSLLIRIRVLPRFIRKQTARIDLSIWKIIAFNGVCFDCNIDCSVKSVSPARCVRPPLLFVAATVLTISETNEVQWGRCRYIRALIRLTKFNTDVNVSTSKIIHRFDFFGPSRNWVSPMKFAQNIFSTN